MTSKDKTYQYYFPNYFGKENNFIQHLKRPDDYQDHCLGKYESYFTDSENYGTTRKLKGISESEKYKREYLWNEFGSWRKWIENGKNLFSFSHDLLLLLDHTDVDKVELETLKFPYDNFYLSLQSLNLPFVEGEPNLIDGVYINIAYNDHADDELTHEFSLNLDFAGDYEKFAIKYNDSISESFNFSFKYYSLTLDKKIGTFNVKQALLENKEFFRGELVLTEEDKLIDIFQFNQQLIDRTIRVVINCLLYLSLPDREVRKDFASDIPGYLISRLSKAKTKRKKEVVKNEIEQLGFTKINFVGQSFVGTISEHRNVTGGVLPHWRRGHWRNQKLGAGLMESKLIWIKPTIINKDLGVPAKGHIYVDE
jgi:hypothetical protein